MFTPRFKAGQRINVKVFRDQKGKLLALNVDTSLSQDTYKEMSCRPNIVEMIAKIVPADFEEPFFDRSDNTYRVLPIPTVYHADGNTLLVDIAQGYFWVHDSFMEACYGMTCEECRNGFAHAEPNFQDNKLICWSCVDSRGWKYQRVSSSKIILR
jgi:hypothetical protein